MQNKKPMLLVLAGPNGSGKSTIINFFEKVGTYTNADDIVATTGMDKSSAFKLNILKTAKEHGYFIKCVFVLTVNPQINIARIESRVALGGHNVDSVKVVERYYKSLNNIKELLAICDIMHVYDNTETPKRIIRKHKDDLSIYPNEYWNEKDILKLIE